MRRVPMHMAPACERPRSPRVAAVGILVLGVVLAGLVGGGCRCPRVGATASSVSQATPLAGPAPATPAERARLAARGAVPGGTDGPGGFVARGSSRNYYAGRGGRLWYYLNNYYWAPADLDAVGVWIRAEVHADFVDLLRWPDRGALASPPTKRTVEYWALGPGQRSVRLDNHKDYWLLDPKTCAGSARVEVTLTFGRLQVQDAQGTWAAPSEGYVLESRSYRTDDPPGIGAARARFEPLADRPTTTWTYDIPWSTGASPLTRSTWQDLALPTWRLLDARSTPAASDALQPLASEPPVVTPSEPARPDEP